MCGCEYFNDLERAKHLIVGEEASSALWLFGFCYDLAYGDGEDGAETVLVAGGQSLSV
jgi:hypothetical protein